MSAPTLSELQKAAADKICARFPQITTKEFRGLVRGEYGKTPVAINPEFRKQIIGDLEPIDHRPADDLSPEIESLRERVMPYAEQDEDLLSLALFENVAVKFFEWRKNQRHKLDPNSDPANGIHSV